MIAGMSKKTIRFTNLQLAEIFENIADLLEITGEVIYKTLAYRKASDSLRDLGQDAFSIWQNGNLTDIPGVGKAIAEKIRELFETGQLKYYENLKEEVPLSLLEILEVPDVGPKKAALFWKEAGITDLGKLQSAAETGKLRSLPGMGQKSEQKILDGIEALSRRTDRLPLGIAWPFAQELLDHLRPFPAVELADAGGSLRRMRDTVGDLDIVAATNDPEKVMEFFTGHERVIDVISQGSVKSSVEFDNHIRVQLWVQPPERYGTVLQYASGSKDHNVRLRELALKKGLSLSDQAFTREDGTELLCADEEQVYTTLALPWIPPELREDRGEVQAAMSDTLPELIQVEDIRLSLHTHSSWSDGQLSILEMAEAASERGYHLLAVTDHSVSLGVANGLSVERLRKQKAEIEAVREEIGDKVSIIQGAEVEIKADGSLDYPDEVLAGLDIVIASLHTSLRQPREQVTERMLNAIRNPHVDIIAHPTGRMIPDREGADLDMEAVFKAAAEFGVVLEINAHPSRLDLNDVYAKRAVELGIKLAINTDAHSAGDLDLLFYGVATAKRGWVTPGDVINTWDKERLLGWLKGRKK
jgi:DNA polymerase (family 10)